jgi:hypothetical protein
MRKSEKESMELKTRRKLTSAFRELRGRGWTARASYKCCLGCATAAMSDELGVKDGEPWVLYHRQDAEGLRERGQLYLAHGSDVGHARELVDLLVEKGLDVEWDGTMNHRVKVIAWKEVA